MLPVELFNLTLTFNREAVASIQYRRILLQKWSYFYLVLKFFLVQIILLFGTDQYFYLVQKNTAYASYGAEKKLSFVIKLSFQEIWRKD